MAADGTFFNRPKSVSRSARVVHFNSAAYKTLVTVGVDVPRVYQVRHQENFLFVQRREVVTRYAKGNASFLAICQIQAIVQ